MILKKIWKKRKFLYVMIKILSNILWGNVHKKSYQYIWEVCKKIIPNIIHLNSLMSETIHRKFNLRELYSI